MMTRRSTRRGSQRRGLATFLLVTLGVFGLTCAGSVLGSAGGMFAAYAYFSSDLPDPNVLDGIRPAESTYVYDRTGEVLLARFECQNREAVEFEELPPLIWEATIASEDRTFWENNGVDFQGLVRAALANLEAGEIVQGASTITQQVIDYARVLQAEGAAEPIDPVASQQAVDPADPDAPAENQGETTEEEETDVCQPPAPRNSTEIDEKIRENILAMQVTAAYPGRAGKERILETYLNLIYYGNGSYGIRAAAANYFGLQNLEEMTIAQAAFLAALPQAPSFLDPYQNAGGEPGSEEAAADAIRERNLVLGAMVEEGYITAAQAREARETTWTEMNPKRLTSVLREPQFGFRVRDEAARILESLGYSDPQAEVRTGGYRIRTTLDYELQQEAKRLVAKWVDTLGGFNVNNGALVAIDSTTGEIIS
jgi:membrane peptidoglycan carboxypeptidase